MKSGTRIKLLRNVITEHGQEFKKGQTGTVMFRQSPNIIVVDFDGYEKERQENKRLREKGGEGWNIPPWADEIPSDALEEL